MAPPSPAPSTAAKKTRAKQACRVCNSRRVRCNVMDVQPCDNCVAGGVTCEIVPSRRGRYPRRSKRQQQGSVSVTTDASTTSMSPRPSLRAHSTIQPAAPVASTSNPARPDEPTAAGAPPTPGTLFFGESNFITLVPGTAHNRHVFSVPETPQDAQAPDISPATMRYLKEEGALTLPDLQTCLPALQAYFKWFHPCFPILDRAEITQKLAAMTISRLLLQAMLFIGATYCDEETITAMGFRDRTEAKRLLYGRARIFFHADWEKDRMILIQSLFLMSFWRGDARDVRDVRYWLGVVITLAESHGLHRSEKIMSKDPTLSKMRRRIWWSIYVRERQAAASLGLPSRIRDEDCDIEALSASDLESDTNPTVASLFGACEPQHVTYVVKMVEIARLLGRVIDVQFVPGQKMHHVDHIPELDARLEEWRSSLPPEMQYSSDDGSSSIWTCLLHFAYNHLRILIHRTNFMRFPDDDPRSQVVTNAACRISRIAEDMSAQGTLRYGQMHLITSLFAALCIHALGIRRSKSVNQRIAEHRAQLCLLCLKEVQKYWRVNNNVLDLFLQYLDSSIAKRLHGHVDEPSTTTAPPLEAPKAPSAATSPAAVDTGGSFEDQYPSLVNGEWEGDDALGDLSLFLCGGEGFMGDEGLDFLGRSL